MDKRLTPEEKNMLVEDALKDYPLASMPRSVSVDVLGRIQKDVRPALVTWNDFVLSLVIAICIAALFFTLQSMPPIILAKLRIQGIILYQYFLVNARWLVPALLFSLSAIFAAMTIPYLQRELRSK